MAGYGFSDEALLRAALTHRSYLHEHPDDRGEDFERLEFVGDAVIALVIGEDLYRRFPDAREGELTALRAMLVSSTGLAAVSMRLALPAAVRLGRGEEESGGRARIGLAASVYESVVGAVFLEAGLPEAAAFVRRTMSDLIERAVAGPRKSPKTLLQEWAQNEPGVLPVYRLIEVRGPAHHRDFVMEVDVSGKTAIGTGPSKREAQEAAAAKLLAGIGP
ncbi:MAG: ribonuclease III [Candidatus Limnocylindria bacterium]